MAAVVLTGAAAAKAQTYNWSGIYIGANAGWMQTDSSTSWPNAASGLTQSFEHSNSNGVLGGHFGIQQQYGNVLLGLEFAGSGGKNSWDAGAPNTGCPNVGFTCESSTLGGLYQAGLRLGFTSGNWLLYGTGGFASGAISTRSTNRATGVLFDSTSERHNGWYLGGGVEYGLTRNIVLGLEYQHISLDGQRHLSPADPIGVLSNSRTVDADADVVRARLTWLVGFERF